MALLMTYSEKCRFFSLVGDWMIRYRETFDCLSTVSFICQKCILWILFFCGRKGASKWECANEKDSCHSNILELCTSCFTSSNPTAQLQHSTEIHHLSVQWVSVCMCNHLHSHKRIFWLTVPCPKVHQRWQFPQWQDIASFCPLWN